MTTKFWASPVRAFDDAGFRRWGAQLSAGFADAGLVKTGDSGQIDWATVPRPGSWNGAGFEIWRFNDTLQATAPIFIRFDYGCGSQQPIPQIWMTVGSNTDGAGALTGIVAGQRSLLSNPYNYPNTDYGYPTLLCASPGFFGFNFQAGNSCNQFGAVCRTCDNAGAPNGTGAIVVWGAGEVWQFLRFAAPAVAYNAQGMPPAVVPGLPASSLDSTGKLQAWRYFSATPDVAPVFALACVVNPELPFATTFKAAMAGSTERTLISLGRPTNAEATKNPAYAIAMLWE